MVDAERRGPVARSSQRAGVEDQHVRIVRLQHDRDAVVGDVVDDDRDVRVVREQGSEAEREEILEAGDGDGDRRARGVHAPGSIGSRREAKGDATGHPLFTRRLPPRSPPPG